MSWIRNDIETDPFRYSRLLHPFVILLSGADFGIELIVVQEIVSVEASCLALKYGE
jgi:hypothetical protein